MIKEDTKDKISELMDFLQNFIRDNGYPPSTREICASLHIKSTATAHYYLEKATALGYIKKKASKNRAIELCGPYAITNESSSAIDNMLNQIPLVGRIAAGCPITAVENIEDTYSISQGLFGSNDLFMLRVSGESMIDMGIFDGDMVVIHRQDSCDNGDIIAALVDGEDATLKKFYFKDGHVVLHPENSTMSDIIIESDREFSCLGKLVGLIRQFN